MRPSCTGSIVVGLDVNELTRPVVEAGEGWTFLLDDLIAKASPITNPRVLACSKNTMSFGPNENDTVSIGGCDLKCYPTHHMIVFLNVFTSLEPIGFRARNGIRLDRG